MQLPGGGFASSLDADTDHEEGLTYVWSWDELREVLGPDFEAFARIHGVSPEGNWEGWNILNRLDSALARMAWRGRRGLFPRPA